MVKVQAIIPTAGSGVRFQSDVPKPLASLNGKPVIFYTLWAFEGCKAVDSVILVVHPDLLAKYESMVRQNRLTKVDRIIAGGATRQDSVRKGLEVLDQDAEIVLIHDGARPLVSQDLIERCIRALADQKAVIAAVPVNPTIKLIDREHLSVKKTLDREDLWEVQTPQVFQKEILLKAHEQDISGATDDSTLVELLGVEVKVIQGSYKNIKITTQEDLVMVQALLKESEVL